MNFLSFIAHEATRNLIVRGVSRGGDYTISVSLITIYGETWFIAAVILGASFNGLSDYFGQKLWAFKQSSVRKQRLFKELLPYLLLRGCLALIGFAWLALMFFWLDVPYYLSALIVTGGLWILSYKVSKVLFTGSSRGMPLWFRKTWIGTRHILKLKVRSS